MACYIQYRILQLPRKWNEICQTKSANSIRKFSDNTLSALWCDKPFFPQIQKQNIQFSKKQRSIIDLLAVGTKFATSARTANFISFSEQVHYDEKSALILKAEDDHEQPNQGNRFCFRKMELNMPQTQEIHSLANFVTISLSSLVR